MLGTAFLLMSFTPAVSQAAGPNSVNCSDPATRQVTGRRDASLRVAGPGSWCIHDARLSGVLRISHGANVKIRNSVLRGAVRSTHGGELAVCGSKLTAALVVRRATGFVLLGGRAGSHCAGSSFSRTSILRSSRGVKIAWNVFGGSLRVDHTRGGAGTVIAGNTFSASVTCDGNQPPPTDARRPNKGSGVLLHQCASPRPGTIEHAANDRYTTARNTGLTVAAPGVLANDSDSAGNRLTAMLVSGPAHGTLVLSTDGSLRYTPETGYQGPDSFTYRANDGLAASNTAAVSIHVGASPVAAPDAYTADQNSALTIAAPGVLANDSDPGGYPIAAILVTGPAHGTLTLDPNGSFIYRPTTTFSGSDGFTYQASDGFAKSNPATVTITVNGPPIVINQTYATIRDRRLDVAKPGVLTGATDPGGHAQAAVVTGPTHGSIGLDTDGSLRYTPNPGYFGPDGFTFKAHDGTLDSNTATVSIRVDAPPVAASDAYAVNENRVLTVATPGVLGNDTDVDGDALTAVVVSGPAHGSLTLGASGSFVYTPSANFVGGDSFTYMASDGFASSNVAAVSITVNGAPTVVGHSYVTNQGVTLVTPAPGVLAGLTDPGGHAQAVVVAGPAHGTLTLSVDGSFTYVPSAGYSGPDSFTFRAHDGTLDSNVATALIKVNAPPVANNDFYTVLAGGVLNQPAAGGVLSNDTDSDGDALTAVLVAGPAHGSVTLNGDGSFVYTPSGGYHGPDSFTYRASDGLASSNTATVSIRVDAPPVAVNDSYVVAENTLLTVAAPGVLGNDSDADGDPLTSIVVANATHGSVALNANGSFTYMPASNFTGSDSFTYKANDGFADSNVATVSLTVSGAPTVVDQSYATPAGVTLTVAAPGVLTGANDPGGSPLTAAVLSAPAHGTLTLNTNGSFTYVPAAGFVGSDSFTFKANDGTLDSNVGTATIAVTHVNQAPVNAVPGGQSVNTGGSLVFNPANTNAISVSDSDALASDVEQVGLSVGHGKLTIAPGSGVSVTGGADGSANVTIRGTLAMLNAALNGLTYAPAAGYFGGDTLSVVSNDLGHNGTGGPQTATSSVVITVVAAPPMVVAQSYTGAVGNTKFEVAAVAGTGPEVFRSGSALAGDSDPNGGTLSVTAATIAAGHGSVAMAADGTFVYIPAVGFSGPTDTFSYTVNTSEGTSATATATIHFTGLRVWYVNGDAATNGDGRSTSPFNSLAAFGGGRPDAASDTIFLYRRTAGAYAGGITLLGSESLLGQSAGLSSGADVLVAGSGANSVLTNSGGDGIDLANANTIQGIDVTSASGAGIAGSGVSTATIDTAASGGSISGSGGAGLSLSTGSGNVSVAASITGSTGPAVSITGRGGGTVALSGAISGNAISLQSNGGTTINLTGTLTISSGGGTAFRATGGGSVTTTASANTLTSTTGRALDVEQTTIGPDGLKFQSISSNGAANGILLDVTGGAGSLTVTGNGGTCTPGNTGGCSGGQIQNSVGGDDSSVAPVGTGVVLKDTVNPSLTRMWIHDAGNYAIHGNNVNGFTLDQSVINGTNGTNAATPFNDSSVRFNNLTGAATVSNTAISGGYADNFNVTNTLVALDRITFTSDTIGDNSAAGGNAGILLTSAATAGALKATIQSSTFTGAAGDLLDYNHAGAGSGDLVITGSHFSNNHPGIATGGGGLTLGNSGTSGPTTMSITSNTFRDAVGNALTVVKSTGPSTLTGTFDSNTIGVAGNTTLGSTAGDGLKLQTAGQGTLTWHVTNNSIYGFANFGVDVLAGGSATPQSGTVNATITTNTIANPTTTGGFPTNGIQLNIGTVATDTYQACLAIGGAGPLANTVNATGTNTAPDIRPRQRQATTIHLPGYGGAANDNTAVDNFVQNNNKTAPSVLATNTFPTGGGFTGGTPLTCP